VTNREKGDAIVQLNHNHKNLWHVRQGTYNVTSRRVRANTVAVEKQKVLYILRMYVCSHRYPAWNEHAPYCNVVSRDLLCIFTLYDKRQHFRKKKDIEHKMHVSIFVWNISYSKKKWVRYDQECILVFM